MEETMRKFKLERDYYEEGEKIFKKSSIAIQPGVTVLVGCNGAGKTTLLKQIEHALKVEKIPCVKYDNLHEGAGNAVSEAAFFEDFGLVAQLMCSSEGENISLNIGMFATKLRMFVNTGKTKSRLPVLHENNNENESNERWILFDAIDSGLSIDNIEEIKDLFNLIIEDGAEKDVYIIVSANEYELARGEQCFDVYNGKYVTFSDYEDYRNFILKSREKKNQRYSE